MKELKIGYLALSKLSWKTPRIEGLAKDTAKELAKMEGCKLIAPEGLVTSEKGHRPARKCSPRRESICWSCTLSPSPRAH